MSDMIVIEVSVSTNRVGSRCSSEFEVDEQEWAGMSEDEKEETWREDMYDLIEWNYRIL